MNERIFWKIYSNRSLISFFVIISLFFGCILRLSVIATSNYREVQIRQSSLKIKLSNLRGTIYDKNLVPLTNNEKKILACVSPIPRAVTAISSILKGEELRSVLDRLKEGKPIVCEVPEKIEYDGIICTEIYTSSPIIPAIHTLGYTDNDNKGVTGLQKAYDELLYSEKTATISYACDGLGKILKGVKPILQNDTGIIADGVVTTIDINIQNILEELSLLIDSGAIVVAESSTAKIRGIVSRPNFDQNAINEYLNKENSPLYNRTTAAYNVGSVFKPCVAIAALENGYKNFTHNCTGSFEIIDRVFRCHKSDGHGLTNLNIGLMNSCNTFFYNLAFLVGKDKIYNTAKTLNFGEKIKICDGIYTANSSMPNKDTLKNIAHLANLSIGQGELTATPISMLNLYNTIANGGKYYLPSIVESTLKNGIEEKYKIGSPTLVCKSETAENIKYYLKSVVDEGTGVLAKPKTVTAAGKTATAQTGKFKNGTEICSSWFCGFFPFENPKYTVIVFCEDNKNQTKSCAEVFSEIADRITLLES